METGYDIRLAVPHLLMDKFSLPKTTAYLKEHIAHMLQDSLEDKHDCYFKAIAIVGISYFFANWYP